MSGMRFLLVAALVLATGLGPAVAQGETGGGPDRRALLDSIRSDLVELRFEKALAAIEALLGQPGMTPSERGEALVLRAQAHVAFGDLDAAEEDFREILRLRPGYRPEASLTPTKAMQRFNKIRAQMIGRIKVVLDPADAVLFVDGTETVPDPSGLLMLLAGEHVVRAERGGHDPEEQAVQVAANAELELELRLVPNARTVVLRTEPEGVEVTLYGTVVGTTRRPESSAGGMAPAELVLENLPLGEHEFELNKECYRRERLTDTLTVDLLDRAPKRYRTVTLSPTTAAVELRGGVPGAEVRVDGSPVGRLTDEPIATCPGTREVELHVAGRLVWRETVRLGDGQTATVEFAPRPNVMLLGANEWPAGLADLAAAFNRLPARATLPDGDPGDARTWATAGLPRDVDLAVGVARAERQGAVDRWFLYSPILRSTVLLERVPSDLARPRWTATTWGAVLVDSAVGGPARVVEVTPGGTAEQTGLRTADRILELGGRAIASAREAHATLAIAASGRPIRVKWDSVEGEREGEWSGREGPWLVPDSGGGAEAIVRAAWALVDSLAGTGDPSAPRANLALLLAAHGQLELAAESWRRVDWGDRSGIGAGTRDYYLGSVLERLGDESAAVEAYRRAAASAATTFDDLGPPVAPAARDRLADLGVQPDPSATAR